jgi:hypothetical protein
MSPATQWLFDQLWDTPKDKFTWYALLKKANKMHENQIMDAYIERMDCTDKKEMRRIMGGQYYKETFGK